MGCHDVSASVRIAGTVLVSVLALTSLAAASARAQDSEASTRPSWMAGGSIGMLGVGTQPAPLQLTTVSMHFTQLRPNRLGADVAVGTVPYLLVSGGVVLAARAGVTLPLVAAPGFLFLPSVGASVIGAASTGGGAGIPGLHAGAAAVLGSGPLALRTGVTFHRMADLRPGIWLAEVGFVRMPTPARARE